MKILVLSLNHTTAPVGLRERVALQGERLTLAIDQLRSAHPMAETVIVSTCNRTEVYIARPAHDAPSFEDVVSIIAGVSGVSRDELSAAALRREGEQAVMHLFRVCSGLESMVLGEPQVLGQVRRAYEHASSREAVGPVLHKVFQQALAVAKNVRTQTGIDAGRVSIGSAAVEFARRIFDTFSDKTIVGVGAGEMAKLSLRHMMALRPARLWLTNRTHSRAQTLAHRMGLHAPHGGARPFEDLDVLLVEADIVITSTGADHPIITAQRFRPLIKRRRFRPIFIIDIALPRDVEPEVGSLSNVYLYNIDDLQKAIASTHTQRADEVHKCETMLAQAVQACVAEVQNRDIGRLIRALRTRLHEIAQAETDRTTRKLTTAATPADVEALLQEHTHRLVNKILHLPVSQLDRRNSDAERSGLGFYAAALRRLFDLHETETRMVSEAESPHRGRDETETGNADVTTQPATPAKPS